MVLKDLRDPRYVGEALLFAKERKRRFCASDIADAYAHALSKCPDYNANPSCIEKYGRPQDLPPTPF